MSANVLPRLLPLLLLTIPLTGYAIVGGIFRAGFVTALIAIVLVVAVVWFFMRGRR